MSQPSWEQALNLIQNGQTADALEHQRLEFKQAAPSLKDALGTLADAAVCFANAEGGVIVVGVADKVAGPEALIGVPTALTIEAVRQGIYDRTVPPITVLAEVAGIGSVNLMVVTVPAGLVPCSTTAGTATRRLDRACRPFTPDQQRDWLAARGMVDWSAATTALTIEDIDPIEMARVRSVLQRAGKAELSRLEDARLLEALRLIDDGHLVRAGVLLVGHEEAMCSTVPTHGHIYQYRETPGQESLLRIRETRPLLAAIEQILEAIAIRSRQWPLNLTGGTQVAVEELPASAVRELVVNAFIHRNYETQGTVDIDHSSDGLVIVSPGGLVSGVTPANILTHPSTPRNRRLAEAITTLAIAERTGQGIDRAFRSLLRMGKEPVDFDDRGTSVRAYVSGTRGNEAFVRFVHTSLPDGMGEDIDVLLLLRVLCHRAAVGPAEVARLIQRSEQEATQFLQRLLQTEPPIVAFTKRGSVRLAAHTVAGLGRAITYRVASPDEYDNKVTDHLAEYGTISNRTLQRLFNLNVYAARDLLRDLQRRNIVVKLSDATSGPGVTYGPAPVIADPVKHRRDPS